MFVCIKHDSYYYKHICIVYNSLQSSKRTLEQAYNRKFSLSETIQVVNRLSSETIQKISSARRDLDEMLVGRGKLSAKDLEGLLKPSEKNQKVSAHR
jgi:hypothetical protein